MNIKNSIACLLISLLFCQPGFGAERIWKADFSSYEDGQSIPLDAKPKDDCFSSLSAPGSTSIVAVNGKSVGLKNGLSLKFTSTAKGNRALRLNNLFTSDHKLIVVSFDRANKVGAGMTLSVNALAEDNSRPHEPLPQISAAVPNSRFTMVINLTGQDVTLGNGKSLAHNSIANYYKTDKGRYEGYKSTVLTGAPTGFSLIQREPAGASFPVEQMFDNFGVWVSTDGSVAMLNETDVMKLDFGTVIP